MTDTGENRLVRACKDGQTDRLRELIQGGENVNQSDRSGYTGLHWAAFNGHQICVSLLLDNEIIQRLDINAKDSKGGTPLMKAAVKGKCVIVKMLVDKGALVDEKDHNGVSALHFSCERGFSDCVDVLAKVSTNINQKTNQFGWTALHIAALRGEEMCCRSIVTHGADVNALDMKFSTPLMLTASKGHDHIVRMLMLRGGQLSQKDINNLTALHYAARYGHSAAAEALLKEAEKSPGSLSTDDAGNEDAHRYTPLHFIAEANRQAEDGDIPEDVQAKFLECCKILVDGYGAGVQPIASTLVTPLHIAADVGNTLVAEFLLKHGANPNATNTQGDTPLHFAASRKREATIAVLVTHGASLGQESYDGITPINYCPLKDIVRIVYNTVFEGNLEKTDQNDYTILHHLCRWGQGEWLDKILEGLEHKVKIDLLFKGGATPSPFVMCLTAGNDSLAANMVTKYYKRKSRAAVEFMVNTEYQGMNILHAMLELKSYQTLVAVFDLLVHEADENYITLLPDLLNINELGQKPVLPGLADKDEEYDMLSPTLYQKLNSIKHDKIILHPVVSLLTKRKASVYNKFNFCSFLLFTLYLIAIYLLQFTLSYTRMEALGNHHWINFLSFLVVVGLTNDLLIVIARYLSILYRRVKRGSFYYSNWKTKDNMKKDKTQVTWFTSVQYDRKYAWIVKAKDKLRIPSKIKQPIWFVKHAILYVLRPVVLLEWLGILSLFVYLITYWIGIQAQWVLASISFILNTLRLFKYISYSEYLGPYIATLYLAFTRDFPRFLIVFTLLLITFTGGFSLSIVPVNNSTCSVYEDMAFCNASQTFLSGFRVLLEGHLFNDVNFIQFLGFYPSLIYSIFIVLVVVFLINFLVAQFCGTYLNELPSKRSYKLRIATDFENTSLTYLLFGRIICVLTAVIKAKVTHEFWEKIRTDGDSQQIDKISSELTELKEKVYKTIQHGRTSHDYKNFRIDAREQTETLLTEETWLSH